MEQFNPDTIPAEVLDELLSAAIDDQLDAAIVDLGFAKNAEVLRAWLTDSPKTAPRRAVLQIATQLLGQDGGPPIDDLERRRLVRSALDTETPTRRHGSLLLRTGSFAAAAAFIVAVLVSLNHTATTRRDSRPSAAPIGATATSRREIAASPDLASLPDIGNITSLRDVQHLLSKQLHADAATSAGSATTTDAVQHTVPHTGLPTTTAANPNTPNPNTLGSPGAKSPNSRTPRVVRQCLHLLPGADGHGPDFRVLAIANIRNIATATLNGTRVVIATSSPSGHALVLVYRSIDCVVLLQGKA